MQNLSPSPDMMISEQKSFLRWAGGKRWLIQNHSHLLPHTFNLYYEPFIGGGAVFFHLSPEKGVLSDINFDLINCYASIKRNWYKVFNELQLFERAHSKSHYYEVRGESYACPFKRAAHFIYLNRTCWNGLYRVNRSGIFNVPFGKKEHVILPTDNFEMIAERLKGIDILHSDFEKMLDQASAGDFVFIDPPYTVKHNYNGFREYNENLFSWEDQIRLRDGVVRAISRNVQVLVLNAYHPSIKDLYQSVGEQIPLTRSSLISGKASARGVYEELAIKCW